MGAGASVTQVTLNYGKHGLAVELPADAQADLIRKAEMPLLADPQAAVREALRAPLGAPPLAELARAAASACVVICDITRPVPNGLLLRPLIETLLAAGMPAARVEVLVATGLHRPNLGAELRELVADSWVLDTVKVINHDARDDAELVDLGRTEARATPVLLNRHLVNADLKIVTGLVEPHFMAGYSGGRKVIAPGVAGKATITTFHNAEFMGHPLAANCVLDGNPLHQEQLEIVRLLGGAYAVNTVIDEQRRLTLVNFGEIVQSHLAAVEFVRAYAEVPVPRRYHTVLTSAAGYPLDKTYYQTVKGMVGPLDILAPGGRLIIASACDEGLGSDDYAAAQRRLCAGGGEEFLRQIGTRQRAEIDEWQTQMQLKPQAVGRVQLYSDGLSDTDWSLTGVERVDSLTAAVAASIAASGDPVVAVVPEGPYLVPRYSV